MEEKRGKGHPRSFKDEKEFIDTFNNYIDYCKQIEYLPNIAGFCVYADITRETFYNQEEYYFDTYKKIQQKLEDATINAKINDTFKIFYMKNKFNYRDKTEVDSNVKLEDKTQENLKKLSVEELKKLAGG